MAGDEKSSAFGFGTGLALFATVCVVTVVVYGPGLAPLLVLDDYPSIEPLLKTDATAVHWRDVLVSPTGPLGRPVAMLSFLFDRAIHGGDLSAWKHTNLGLHLVTGGGIFALAHQIFRLHNQKAPVLVAWFVTTVWLLHPLQVSTVLYTVQRMTQLSMLFCILGMLSYTRARSALRDTRTRRALLASPFVVWLPLAAFSKENGALLPLFLILLEATVLRTTPDPCQRPLRWVFALYLGGLCLGGMMVLTNIFGDGAAAVLQRRGFTAYEHLLTQPRAVLEYLHQILLPARSTLGFFHDDIALSHGLLAPPATALAVFVHLGLLGLCWRLRARLPVCAFGCGLFYAGHVLESSFIPLELMFEHRNYLPSFGILLAVVALIGGLRSPLLIRASWAAGLGILGVLALVSNSVVRDWSAPARFYRAAFALHPDSPVARAEWAEFLTVVGRYDEAGSILAESRDPAARLQMWVLDCRSKGVLPAATLDPRALATLSHVSVYAVTAMTELANQALDGRCAMDHAVLARMLGAVAEDTRVWPPFRYRLLVYRAHLLWRTGQQSEAFEALDYAARLAPEEVLVPLLTAEWRISRGENSVAREVLGSLRAARGAALSQPEMQMLETLEAEASRAQR